MDFSGYADAVLDEFASSVVEKLTGNAAFPNPPLSVGALGGLRTAFHAALVAAAYGGMQLVAVKDAARVALEDALRAVGYYVQSQTSQRLDVMLTSGYFANSTNRTSLPLDPPTIAELSALGGGQMLLRLTPVTNARSYQVQTSTNGGTTWSASLVFTAARRIVLDGLTPGTTYTVRACAIGGRTGTSDWSNPTSAMAT
ncbi:MAG: hypothetical protein RLZZ350_1973 [Verrucomicrobiota bacterium]|jgi:hypothetical protein